MARDLATSTWQRPPGWWPFSLPLWRGICRAFPVQGACVLILFGGGIGADLIGKDGAGYDVGMSVGLAGPARHLLARAPDHVLQPPPLPRPAAPARRTRRRRRVARRARRPLAPAHADPAVVELLHHRALRDRGALGRHTGVLHRGEADLRAGRRGALRSPRRVGAARLPAPARTPAACVAAAMRATSGGPLAATATTAVNATTRVAPASRPRGRGPSSSWHAPR